jgi:hypothetical protein
LPQRIDRLRDVHRLGSAPQQPEPRHDADERCHDEHGTPQAGIRLVFGAGERVVHALGRQAINDGAERLALFGYDGHGNFQ